MFPDWATAGQKSKTVFSKKNGMMVDINIFINSDPAQNWN